MKYVQEFRKPEWVKRLVEELHRVTTRPWVIMEICGGQTHSILKNGIHQLIPDKIELVHGPGCPVCVTPTEIIDQALTIAKREGVIFTSFGDMLRVPGSKDNLLQIRSQGADVRMVYSPMEAVQIARNNPDREVVFFAIGFETTIPANALAVYQAAQWGVKNFSVLVSQVLVPPAMRALLDDPENRVNGYLAAGHVCTVMGTEEYEEISAAYKVPIVVTGFEAVDLLKGILYTVRQLEKGAYRVENAYPRAVKREGNPAAKQMMRKVFTFCDQKWRGLGLIPQSGMCLRKEYQAFNAAIKFSVAAMRAKESSLCISGEILKGVKKPVQCPAFGKQCTPRHPLGATMVSSEGACAAYFKYHLS